MTITANFKMVLKNLFARKGRSFLTILGIIIGVTGVILIIALGAGAQSLVLSQVTKLGSNVIGVLPGKSDESGPPAQAFGVQIKTLTLEDAQSLTKQNGLSNVEAVAPFVRGNGTVIYNDKSVDTFFTGTLSSVTKVQNVPLYKGRFFDEREERGTNVAVIGWSVYEQIFEGTGIDPIGQVIKIRTSKEDSQAIPFEIVGVGEKLGTVAFQNQDDQVYIPLTIAQQQLLGIKHLQFIRLKVDDANYVKASIEQVKEVLRSRHRIYYAEDDDFSVRDLADALKLLSGITGALKIFLTAMASLSLIVGGIGIMNIMLVTVSERTREIGLRKAVGATNSQIRNQFLFESSILTFSGGLIGIVIGTLLAYVVAIGARYAGYDWVFAVSPISILLAVGVSVLTGVIFGLYPAYKAAKLSPIEALRYE